MRHMAMRYGLVGALAATGLWAVTAGTASASLPTCEGVGPKKAVTSFQGPMESIAFDRQGRLLFTNMLTNSLVRWDSPQAKPATLAKGISSPGGISVASERDAFVGVGNSLTGLLPRLGKAGIVNVNLHTGAVTQVVSGLAMANGMVRADDGTFYASDDLAQSLDRVLPDGTVERGWLRQNSNGLALSLDQHTLYVNQMVPARILAVDRATGVTTVVADAPASHKWSWLDGLDIDSRGNLYVVSYWGGEVWRLDPRNGAMCVLVKGLVMPSAVAVGKAGAGFAADSVYITTHSGRLWEVPRAAAPGATAAR